MSAFTPGPWLVKQASSWKDGVLVAEEFFVARDEDDVSICADVIDPDTDEPSRANAALITASPDLLTSLEKIIDAADARYEEYGDEAHPDILAARAAIAKAKGQGPGAVPVGGAR